MTRTYVGLASTCHDPALAIVDEGGRVVFAEATERPLQYKRAWGLLPDDLVRLPGLLAEHADPGGSFVLATSWSRWVYRLLALQYLGRKLSPAAMLGRGQERASPFLFRRYKKDWLSSHLFHSIRAAGSHLVLALRDAYENVDVEIRHYPHHRTHAVAACRTSPFERAACLVADGFGEFGALGYYVWEAGRLRVVNEVKGHGSPGFFFGRVTELCGFDWVRGEDWKVMGLAPYGTVRPEIEAVLRELVAVDGLAVRFPRRTGAIDRILTRLSAFGRRPGEDPLRAADLAATAQHVFEGLMTALLARFHAMGVGDDLVLGGGCALNSTCNGLLLARTPFRRLHVPMAPGDDGNALGAAWMAHAADHPGHVPEAVVHSPYLGSRLAASTLERLRDLGRLPGLRHLPGTVHEEAARILAEGKIIGWARGPAEFGPRALGNRSILADPRPPGMKDRINAGVKFREEFRPFAPAILDERGPEYFEDYATSPYMERTLRFTPAVRDRIPAVVHENGTGRLQSVRREWNPALHDLLTAFDARTGVPVLLNTSFNVMGKPILHSVEDALAIFHTTDLDALVLEDYLLEK